jgi:repressor of nif and glnA expression
MILTILEKSEAPVPALCVSFKINEMSGKIINLNVVKDHLEELVEKRKIIKKVTKDESTLYSLRNKQKNS